MHFFDYSNCNKPHNGYVTYCCILNYIADAVSLEKKLEESL